jgi:hypothetical protein
MSLSGLAALQSATLFDVAARFDATPMQVALADVFPGTSPSSVFGRVFSFF